MIFNQYLWARCGSLIREFLCGKEKREPRHVRNSYEVSVLRYLFKTDVDTRSTHYAAYRKVREGNVSGLSDAI